MKWVIGVILAMSSGVTVASDLPDYPGNISGTALTSLTSRDTFGFQAGTVGICARTDASSLTSYTCGISGAQATVSSASGKTISVALTTLVAQYVSPPLSPAYRRFIFTGSWSEGTLHSAVRLELWYYNTTPGEIHGSFALSDLGVSASIVGSPNAR